jgi:hypothetical protein
VTDFEHLTATISIVRKQFELPNSLAPFSYEVYSIDGRKVASGVQNNPIFSTLEVNRKITGAQGIYIVRYTNANKQTHTVKIHHQ